MYLCYCHFRHFILLLSFLVALSAYCSLSLLFWRQRKVLFIYFIFDYLQVVNTTTNSPWLGNKAVIQTSDQKRSVESLCKQPHHQQIIRKEHVLHNSFNKSGGNCVNWVKLCVRILGLEYYYMSWGTLWNLLVSNLFADSCLLGF